MSSDDADCQDDMEDKGGQNRVQNFNGEVNCNYNLLSHI